MTMFLPCIELASRAMGQHSVPMALHGHAFHVLSYENTRLVVSVRREGLSWKR